jgi:ribonuclease P protein component
VEIQELFQQGKRDERPSFVALWKPRAIGRLVGFAVSRRVGGSVARNRARRRLREAYRHEREALEAGVMAVFVARPAAMTRRFGDLREEMRLALETFNRAIAREEPRP